MKDVNRIINESGLSKVSIAKYLGVSRQMLYNYLALEKFMELPKDKQTKLLSLFGVEKETDLVSIKVDDDYVKLLENRINVGITDTYNRESITDLKGLNKKEQTLLTDIFNVLKERVLDDDNNRDQECETLKYLLYYIQAMEQVEELKYILAYMAKANGFTKPLKFIYDEDRQYIFEGILYSAMTLYNSGGASRNRVAESHKKFEEDIEQKNEEVLSRTQELNSFKALALNELGYTSINEENAKEVFEKIAEIMSRKC